MEKGSEPEKEEAGQGAGYGAGQGAVQGATSYRPVQRRNSFNPGVMVTSRGPS